MIQNLEGKSEKFKIFYNCQKMNRKKISCTEPSGGNGEFKRISPKVKRTGEN